MWGERLQRIVTSLEKLLSLPPVASFLSTRLGLYLLMYLGLVFIPVRPDPERFWRFSSNLFVDGWVRWDAAWYRQIMVEGYSYTPWEFRPLLFFPGYPYLVKVLYLPFKAIVPDPIIMGIIVSNASFLGALLLLYFLVRRKLGQDAATASVIAISIYPFSFFFSAPYAEALFLLLVVGSFYAAERGAWWAAGLLSALASATEKQGVVLLPALVLLYLSQKRYNIRALRADFLWLLIVPLGFLAYAFFLRSQFEYIFSHLIRSFPPFRMDVTVNFYRWLFSDAIPRAFEQQRLLTGQAEILQLVNVLLVAGALSLVYLVFRYLGAAYAVYSLGMLLIPLLVSTNSFGRYILPVFPLFVALAHHPIPPTVRQVLGVTSLLLLALFTIMYSHWYWIA